MVRCLTNVIAGTWFPNTYYGNLWWQCVGLGICEAGLTITKGTEGHGLGPSVPPTNFLGTLESNFLYCYSLACNGLGALSCLEIAALQNPYFEGWYEAWPKSKLKAIVAAPWGSCAVVKVTTKIMIRYWYKSSSILKNMWCNKTMTWTTRSLGVWNLKEHIFRLHMKWHILKKDTWWESWTS